MSKHVVLPDGNRLEVAAEANGFDIAKQISNSLARRAIALKVNGQVYDLLRTVPADSGIAILTNNDRDALDVLRHSTAHLMAQAVRALYPGVKVTIGPVIEEGFYYDFDYERPFTPDDLPAIEAKMQELAKLKQPIERIVMSREDALQFFADEPYKVELINGLPAGETITAYRQTDFTDLCRGPHLMTTEAIKHFKLMSVAGAYWRGDEKNKMLSRIYGTCFFSAEDLEAHLHRIAEAERRDHRKLGKELELFMFNEVAPSMPFFLPKGTFVYNRLVQYIRDLYARYDYEEVITPLAYDPSIFRTSGHLGNYNENMYRLWTEDQVQEEGKIGEELHDHSFVLKPMNCPSHCVIFGMKKRSYRELPWRVSDFARLHRYERGGVVHGLARVRSFAQDDAHIFCTREQVPDEIEKFIKFLYEVYATLQFDKVEVKLATRPEKRIGSDEQWDEAEAALELGLKQGGLPYELIPGEGAFYGPKIEFHVHDAIGRSWQLGTIQYDPNLPERFDLKYVGEDGKDHRPIMLHRAVLGSLERFFAVYLEHCAGAFPTWLAPVQVAVLPIGDEQYEYAQSVTQKLRDRGIRAHLDDRNESLNYRIRESQLQKIPYMLVLGKREQAENMLNVRERYGEKSRSITLDEFAQLVESETPVLGGESVQLPEAMKA